MPRACLAICLTALLLAAQAPPLMAMGYPAGHFLTLDKLTPPPDTAAPESPTSMLNRFQPTPAGEVLALEMIRDENRHNLQLFVASRETIIPLAYAQLYILHSVRVAQIKRGKVEEATALEEEGLADSRFNIRSVDPETRQAQALANLGGLERLAGADKLNKLQKLAQSGKLANLDPMSKLDKLDRLERFAQIDKIVDLDKFLGLLEKQSVPGLTGFTPLSWLFEEDGLLSGHPWSWDNFLPRLATITGVIIAALFAVEVLRALFGMGGRVMGGGGRGRKGA